MAQATFFEQKSFSPTSLTMVIGIHVALVLAAVAWKIEVIVPEEFIDTKTFTVTEPKADPVDPKPEPPVERTQTPQMDRVEPVVDLRPVAQDPITVVEKPIIPIVTPEWTDVIPETPTQRIEQSATAKGDVRQLISADDYPDRLRRDEVTGTVRARLDIGANGRVTDCAIVATSGSSALDATTCRILKARARFTPAKDSNGQAVADSYTTPKITWRLEGTS